MRVIPHGGTPTGRQTGAKMLTIDAQVHAYGRNHPGRPWHAVPAGPPEVTGEEWR
jgi:hypothetical protein